MNLRFLWVVGLAIAVIACNRTKEAGHIDEHTETKIQYTAYSTDFELFAEADPFVVGETAGILSHFSQLPGFTALENGIVKIRLIAGNREVSQTLDKPTRKGIYKFDLKPEAPGTGRIVFEITTGQGDYQVIVSDIAVYANDEEAIKATGNEAVSRTNTVSFTKEQSWKIDFATAFPEVIPFGQVIKTTAQVQAAQGNEQIVTAKTNGTILFSNGNVLEGIEVASGQALFSISANGLADNNSTVRFLEAQNNYEREKADYERMKELANQKIVSEKELLLKKNEYDNAKAIYENLKNNFSANGQVVKSPIRGFVKQILVTNGQFVEAGQPLLTVSQNRELLLRADVRQKYANLLGSISSATILTPDDNQTYTMEQLNGKVLSYGKNANADNYLIPVTLQIENPGNFISGEFVELYLKTLTNAQALTVPNSSLLEEQGNYYVFVQVNPELFEKREVKTGTNDGLKSEILKGISANDRIVTKGATNIKLAQATGTLDAHSGHVH